MVEARELLDVALLSTGGALLLFGGSACERMINQRLSRGVRAGLFNLSAFFKAQE